MRTEGKVLVIEDGQELTGIITEAARFSTWEFVFASGQAEMTLRLQTERPEIIVLGYLEPRGESFRVHKQLKENPETADIPQIVIDVSPEEQLTRGWLKSEGLRMDAEEYLSQPVTPEELGEIIERILARVKVTDAI